MISRKMSAARKLSTIAPAMYPCDVSLLSRVVCIVSHQVDLLLDSALVVLTEVVWLKCVAILGEHRQSLNEFSAR
jgi:hypothetical protein